MLESLGPSATMIYNAELPPPVRAKVDTAPPNTMPPASPATASAIVRVDPATTDLSRGFRIQFLGAQPTFPASAWFACDNAAKEDSPSPWWRLTIRMRDKDGQTIFNTVWPSAADARIAIYPSKGDLVLPVTKTVAVDLRYSGTGDDPASTWGSLGNKGDVALTFDAVGAIEQLLFLGLANIAPDTRQPVEPVYFLLATRNDIDANVSLASERSLWIAVQPLTGRVTISSNEPQTPSPPPSPPWNATHLRAARAKARAAAAIGK